MTVDWHVFLFPSECINRRKLPEVKGLDETVQMGSTIQNWIWYMLKDLINITKTRLYNFDPLKPHFYIVKLGFTGLYIIFLIFAWKHRLWVLVRTASPSTHNLYFEQKYEKYQSFLSEKFQFLEVKFSKYSNRPVFVMIRQGCITEALPGVMGNRGIMSFISEQQGNTSLRMKVTGEQI